MKKLEKRLAARAGFTLVELIVVITILGILAAVAIPAYSGYIKKANDAAIITELDAIKTAAIAANASAGEIASITISGEKQLTVTVKTSVASNFVNDFHLFYENGKATVTAGSKDVTIELTNGLPKYNETSYKGSTWNPTTGWSTT